MEEKNLVVGRIVKAIMIWLITIAIMMLSFELVVEMGASHWGNGVENARLDKLGVVIFSVVVTVLYAIMFALYRRKKLQEEQKPVILDYAEKFFGWTVGFVGGVIGGIYLSLIIIGLWYTSGLYYVFPFIPIFSFDNEILYWGVIVIAGTLIYFLASRIIRWDFRKPKKADLIGCGEFLLIGAICCVCGFGLIKVEEREVPNVEDVQSAYVDLDYRVGSFWGTSKCKVVCFKEESQKIIDIHKQILADLEYYEQMEADKGQDIDYEIAYISYELKDGTIYTRRYQIPMQGRGTKVIDEIVLLEETPEHFLQLAICDNYEEVTEFTKGNIDVATYDLWKEKAVISAEETEVTLSPEECKNLYEAIIADTLAGNLRKYNRDYQCYKHMNESSALQETVYDIELQIAEPDEEGNRKYVHICYGKDCENILNELIRMGYVESVNHFCWEDAAEVKTDDEVYLENVFCYDYEKINSFANAYIEIATRIEENDYQITLGTYILENTSQEKLLYDAIIADWLAGKMTRYNAQMYVPNYQGEDYWSTETPGYISIDINIPGTDEYRKVHLSFRKDCTNIIKALIELEIINDAKDLCWSPTNYDMVYNESLERYNEWLQVYEDWKNVSGTLYLNDGSEAPFVLNTSQCAVLCEATVKEMQKNELKYATSYTEFAGDFYLHLEFTEPDSEMRREIKFTFDRENSYLEKALKELGLI